VRTVVAAQARPPFFLTVRFDDGTEKTLDLGPLLSGEVFEPLRDPAYFALVTVDEELGTVVWPNGADFAPEFLYAAEDARTPS
jgi:Protein of unknown function (DUF2442)